MLHIKLFFNSVILYFLLFLLFLRFLTSFFPPLNIQFLKSPEASWGQLGFVSLQPLTVSGPIVEMADLERANKWKIKKANQFLSTLPNLIKLIKHQNTDLFEITSAPHSIEFPSSGFSQAVLMRFYSCYVQLGCVHCNVSNLLILFRPINTGGQ